MRDYIQKHIRPSIKEYTEAVRSSALEDYEKEPFVYSGVHGEITDRTKAKNSFIFGKVIMHGNCKLHRCTVADHVTLIMEDGAVLEDCVIGHECHRDSRKITVTIGKNCTVIMSELSTTITLDRGSFIFGSRLCTDGNYDEKQRTELITLGKRVCVINSELRICYVGDKVETETLKFGPDSIVFKAKINTHTTTASFADSTIIGDHKALIRICLQDLADQVVVPEDHPAVAMPGKLLLTMKKNIPIISIHADTDVGNRCLFLSSMLLNTPSKKPGTCFDIGDDVTFGAPGITQYVVSQYTQEENRLILVANKMRIDDYCTVIQCGPNTENKQSVFSDLFFGEGSTVVFKSKKETEGARASVVRVRPYTAAII